MLMPFITIINVVVPAVLMACPRYRAGNASPVEAFSVLRLFSQSPLECEKCLRPGINYSFILSADSC
jgi:hypothetical protein